MAGIQKIFCDLNTGRTLSSVIQMASDNKSSSGPRKNWSAPQTDMPTYPQQHTHSHGTVLLCPNGCSSQSRLLFGLQQHTPVLMKMLPLADHKSFNAGVPRTSRFSHSDVIKEQFKLGKEESHILATKDLGHKVAANFENVCCDVES